ncbi:MAG: hypothetical protein AAB649_00595 [Patescibacteria group bacterium]
MEYTVVTEHFAERHFIKSFSKKYKRSWNVTWTGLLEEFRNFEELFTTSSAQIIAETHPIKICKVEFRVHGTKESRKGSGNRYIVALHADTATAHILLVYGKTDLSGHGETAQWKNLIKANYPEYKNLL